MCIRDSVDLELLVAVRNFELERRFDAAQVLIHGAAQMRQAGVVQGRKKMAQNQADNSFKGLQ
jgi:hypothetical protein